MMPEKRSIPKLADAPPLTPDLISLLTQLCFLSNNPEKSDLLFVFGVSTGLSDLTRVLKGILSKNISQKILITGGSPNFMDNPHLPKPEAEIIYEMISHAVTAPTEVILETKAVNTLENVIFSKEKLEETPLNKILYVGRSLASRRCHLTLSKHFPETKLYSFSYDMEGTIERKPITKDTWHLFQEGRLRVWGEYLRIKQYGEWGDIHYASVKGMVEKIESLTL
jgi:uncharacterized SAM-binding protein YcdF (DUF218 family)